MSVMGLVFSTLTLAGVASSFLPSFSCLILVIDLALRFVIRRETVEVALDWRKGPW